MYDIVHDSGTDVNHDGKGMRQSVYLCPEGLESGGQYIISVQGRESVVCERLQEVP